MSDFYSIRFKGVIKEQFRKDFHDIAHYGQWSGHSDTKLRKFGEEYWLSEFIPTGTIKYDPKSWTTEPDINGRTKDTDGFERFYNEETGEWNFQCSVRVDSVVHVFFNEIVPYVCESLKHGELVVEYDRDYPSLYHLDSDGHITEEEIKYNSEDVSLYRHLYGEEFEQEIEEK